MATITLKTASQTKNFIKRMNKFYKKLDTCKQHGTTRLYTGFNDIDVKVHTYTKHRVKKIGNCVYLCRAQNNTNPNHQPGWDIYAPIEKLAYLAYHPKRITCRTIYHTDRDGNYYFWHTRD